MNNTFSLEQISKTGDLNADLITRQYKLDKMAKFMEIKSNNPKLKQSEIAKELEISTSTVQRYRREINMLSPFRIPPSSKTNHTRKQKIINTNLDGFKVTSNDLKVVSNDLKTTSNESVKPRKNRLKGGSVQDNIEINDHYLDKILHNNDS